VKARKAILPDIGKLSGARTGLLPVFLEPSLASLCEKPPTGPKWIHEIKYDGYRMQARIDGRTIRLLTRKKLDWTERFRSIADALQALRLVSALIDGEIVVEDARGISSFNNLQADLKADRLDRFRYFVFDIFYCEGLDLTKAALKDRKELLQQLLAGLPGDVPVIVEIDGAALLASSL
jgi:bifunctional non-homologous end joining protein LigD